MKFETLYKKSSTGAIVEWDISVQGRVITTTWGQQGGKKQTTADIIREGKNAGRSNGTTPEQQALAEAEAQWTKKLKKDYVKTLDAAEGGESSELIEGGILPMLAHKYADHPEKVKWPAASQPKLDGHRCIAVIDAKGACTLWSRTRKPILSAPHIAVALEKVFKPNTILDGELYNDQYRDKFEELTSLIRAQYPKPGHEAIHYHIYDFVSDEPFRERSRHVQGLEMPLVSVETVLVADEDEMRDFYSRCMEQGYEGAMLRNWDSPYANKRSYDLLKVKERSDAEFIVTGVEEGRGKLQGHGIFVCRTKSGAEFKAKMKGDTEKLKDYWQHPEKYTGKKLTVAYQGLTADGIPRFPVALRFREDL